jgi:GNAT superfamily N-acetyltransferase
MLEIVDYQPQYRKDFERLNREWIEDYFEIEAADLITLTDPEGKIISQGGSILFALWENIPVGTVALVRIHKYEAELAKMCVTGSMRGKNIGLALMEASIAKARKLGLQELVLETNSHLKAAIHLYEKFSFSYEPIGESPYKRANVRMRLKL